MTLSHLHAIVAELEPMLERLERDDVVRRIWAKDHTVWAPEPAEIANRLGWLDLVTATPSVDEKIRRLASGIVESGFRDVVLLAMGGSSLGSAALRGSFGYRMGFPRLHVLDSTHPTRVRRIRQALDPATTIFVVASKSGSTVEVTALFRYFWAETERVVGNSTGQHFIAITDPDTPLATLAREQGFRKTFLNPPDIGGRFSVLSRFGLVNAALAGIDPVRLLAAGHLMAKRCFSDTPPARNPGVRLGAVLAAAARSGRDQLTLLTSQRLATFAPWVEQLVAECTGKQGRGVLPVIAEPPAAVSQYRDSRLFVAIHFAPEPDPELEDLVVRLKATGQPVLEYELRNLYDLGGEFFRWQLACAVAGHLIGVNPFDQPDVQTAKTATDRALATYTESGALPAVSAGSDLPAALKAGPAPRYVALMAYTDASVEFERAIAKLRRCLLDDLGLTTTFGYGPALLHSTGQIYKGGPDGGLFVQLLGETNAEIELPGEAYGLGLLLQAQAAGDLAALAEGGRRCVRINLGDDPASGLGNLLSCLSSLPAVAQLSCP